MPKKKIIIDGFTGIATYDYSINKDSYFVITSYWWGRGNINKNSREELTYDALAERFISDCIKSKCNYIVVEIPEFAVPGGYQKAINFKPAFIIGILNILPKAIERAVYIDTDMSILRHPAIFDMEGYDFMGYNWAWEPRQMFSTFPHDCWDPFSLHTSGGLLLFSKSEQSRRLLTAWNTFVLKYPGKAEDRMLSIPFNDDMMVTDLRCFWLPNEYFWLPYFYENDDVFFVEGKYQRDFKKRGIKFKDGSTKEMSLTKFYGFKNKDFIITHPEMLTSEEMAAKQGADLNRIPEEWFKSQGKKKRCLTEMEKFTLNEVITVEGKSQMKEMRPVWRWLGLSDFLKIEKKTLKIRKIRTKILAQELRLKGETLYLSVAENENEDGDKIEDRIELYSNLGVNYLILKGKRDKIPSIIYQILEKYSNFQDIVYLSLDGEIESPSKIKVKVRELNKKEIDFACVNSLAYPEAFKGLGKIDDVNLSSCDDPRFLNCVNDNILYFRNNRFGKNILKVWGGSSCPRKISSSQRLSRSFNKYLMIIPSRVEWLSPSFSFNVKNLTPKGRKHIPIIKVKRYQNVDNSESNYLYLAQCGEKRGVSLRDESPFATHYKGSVFKRKK